MPNEWKAKRIPRDYIRRLAQTPTTPKLPTYKRQAGVDIGRLAIAGDADAIAWARSHVFDDGAGGAIGKRLLGLPLWNWRLRGAYLTAQSNGRRYSVWRAFLPFDDGADVTIRKHETTADAQASLTTDAIVRGRPVRGRYLILYSVRSQNGRHIGKLGRHQAETAQSFKELLAAPSGVKLATILRGIRIARQNAIRLTTDETT